MPWIEAQTDRVQHHFDLERRPGRNGDGTHAVLAGPTDPLDFARARVRWSRRVPVDTHLANIGSHSLFLIHEKERTAAFFAEEREHLLTALPDGLVEETYDVELLPAVRL